MPSDYERIFVWVVYYVFGIVDWIMHWILLSACWLAAFVGFSFHYGSFRFLLVSIHLVSFYVLIAFLIISTHQPRPNLYLLIPYLSLF